MFVVVVAATTVRLIRGQLGLRTQPSTLFFAEVLRFRPRHKPRAVTYSTLTGCADLRSRQGGPLVTLDLS